MQRHHYLGVWGMIGESPHHVALYKDRWLALLRWAGAALKTLAGLSVPDLASRVLSLNLKRLSDDWKAAHGHPIYVAETRSIWTNQAINGYVDFPHVAQVFWVRREVAHLRSFGVRWLSGSVNLPADDTKIVTDKMLT